MIEVAEVFHHYGLRPILKDVSFQVPTGRTLAVVGPNGSGKTTLLNLVAGLTCPAEGYVAINGKVRRSTPQNERDIRRQTVFVPETCWYPADTTGRQFLLGVAEVYGVSPRRRFDHADRLLGLFQLDHIGDSLISSYSTGQRKKISLCAGLISEAGVVLLDEPFSGGLDPAGITALKQILRHVTQRQDRTVVLTTPVPELVEEVATEVLVLRNGSVLKHASVEELKQDCAADTLDEALRTLIFPETVAELNAYFAQEEAA